MLISVELPLYSAHCYWMYASRITYESQNTHQIRCATPRSEKKVTKPNKLQSSTPKRQLTVGDPVLVQDYRKSRDPWSKGVIVSKLGPVTYCVQVDSFFWKRHVDQLKDLSGTKLPFPRQGESEVVLPQAFSASSSITESIPSSDYTPV